MRNIIALLLLMLSLSSFAVNYEVTCHLMDDFDDWNVYVASETAQFFDNDSNYDMKFWSVEGESWVYYLSDDYQDLTFYFNQKSMEGTLVIDWDGNEEGAEFHQMYCEYESNNW